MKLNEIKQILAESERIEIQLPDGSLVPPHFHVTEIGKIQKNFIDCGGTIREETKVGFQLWKSFDYNHRLHPEKLIHIIELSQKSIGLGNEEIEVEYQGQTIQKFGIGHDGHRFVLTPLHTDCLAKDQCGIPKTMKAGIEKVAKTASSCCTPGGDCC